MAQLSSGSRWLLAIAHAIAAAAFAPQALAQSQGLVVRDGTLGSAPAGVVPPGADDLGTASYLIRADLGEQRGGNLFHSFTSFSIGLGERATFTDQGAPNPGAIDNVVARVTGGSESRIEGTLRSTIPGADVWLLNPSGVVFGQGAQLEVPGTFHASTADSLGFGADGLERFQADPSRPSVLSTARPAAFGFLRPNSAASLEVEGGLAVTRGEARLAGGSVSLADALVSAPGAHLSLEAPGAVELSRSTIDVGGEAPGSISIRGGRLVVQGEAMAGGERSLLVAENTGAGPGGNIEVEARESVFVDNGLLSVRTTGAGNAGTIQVASPKVTFQNGLGSLAPDHPDVGAAAETFGVGTAGTIHIVAQELIVQHGAALSAFAFGGDVGEASGRAGTIEIVAHTLELSDRSFIGVAALGNATNAGTIDIDLGDDGSLHASGVPHADGEFGYAWIVAGTFPQGTAFTPTGKGGDIAISTGSLLLERGAQINVNVPTLGAGDAGSIAIHAADSVTISEGGFIGAVTAGNGQGGTIRVDAGALELRNGGQITAGTQGTAPEAGKGGTIALNAHSITIGSQGLVDARTIGTGKGGNITMNASSITIGSNGGISTESTAMATGQAGDVQLMVDSLAVEPGGFISASSRFATGNAGAIAVTATDSIFLTNEGGDPFDLGRFLGGEIFLSGIFSSTVGGGQGGSITLRAPEITVTHGAIVATSTIAGGDGGAIDLSGDRIRIVNGGFVDTTSGFLSEAGVVISGGRAGSLKLAASESIEVGGSSEFGQVASEGSTSTLASRVSSQALGTGDAGDVLFQAPRVELFDGGTIATDSAADADGGNIAIRAEKLVHLDRGVITASVNGGAGGNITIDPELVLLENGSRIEARAGTGTGGNIKITAENYFAFPDSVISVDADSELGIAGTVEIHSPAANLAATLTPLQTSYLDAASLIRERCAARRNGERAGSFAMRGWGGIAPEPDGWLPASVEIGSVSAGIPVAETELGTPLLLALASCRPSR